MPDIRRFDEFMDEALYGPSGFYVCGGRPAARGGDFATSVELGALFAQCVARYLDRTWDDLGRPDPFVVVEGGAGRGTLCSHVLAHVETCSEALRYVMVERVARQRAEALEAIGESQPVRAAPDLPDGPFVGAVLANELLDNLPFRLLERSDADWQEVHVAPEGAAEVLREAPADAAAMAEMLAPDAAPGARVPLQLKAAVWVRRALRSLERGRLLVFDYGVRRTTELAQRPQSEWLRTYRSQRRGQNPLHAPGTADITCDVAFDQLPPGATLNTQADWLIGSGIESMTAEARARWQQSRSNPTAETLAARTLLDEAAALIDPDGMGAFWAAEWHVG
ncbi:MAG: SAM-dependent methyltransferase [Acidimicrobiaceae bacterium]|uniref:SAM-dependent methyltransferase n=1 Tax=Candidatus Poriferisodalis multihospitum TaxID=2983191 RepID=UPI0023A6686E|nr:SAM-dependent methyltransferase [Candidatus Poriferisodalis multihospitum]MDE0499015.1 SAM-dependent methyltransferase [Acidimicrobiaceae bacterium]